MSAEMINNHKKVVFLDVDGTMVNDRGEIPESPKRRSAGRRRTVTRWSSVPEEAVSRFMMSCWNLGFRDCRRGRRVCDRRWEGNLSRIY